MKRLLLLSACALFLTFLAAPASAQQCLLTFQTEVLPPVQAGVPYNFQIEAVSGTEPYRFEVYQNMIPDGLHLTPKGRLHGKIDEPLDSTVWVTVTDAQGCNLTQAFTVQVF